jgi:hypothetical protein
MGPGLPNQAGGDGKKINFGLALRHQQAAAVAAPFGIH